MLIWVKHSEASTSLFCVIGEDSGLEPIWKAGSSRGKPRVVRTYPGLGRAATETVAQKGKCVIGAVRSFLSVWDAVTFMLFELRLEEALKESIANGDG